MVVAVNREPVPKRCVPAGKGKCALASVGGEPTSNVLAPIGVCGQLSGASVHWFREGAERGMNTRPAFVAPQVAPGLANSHQVPPVRPPEVLDLALAEAEYFRTPDEKAFARIPVFDLGKSVGMEVCSIEGERFRTWLAMLESRTGGDPLSALQRERIIAKLRSRTLLTSERMVHLRVAKVEDAYYIDTGDKSGRAFKITADGWEIVANPPVMFVRGIGNEAYAEPLAPGLGNLEDLWRIVNVPEDERDRVLAWSIECHRPETMYPLLFLYGGAGSAKTTTQRNLRRLVDPNRNPLGGNAATVRDLRATVNGVHVISKENISDLSGAEQDFLCSLATGDAGGSERQHYSHDGVHVLSVKRPVVLNGITDCVTRPDLLARTIVVKLKEPTEYRTEIEMQRLERELMPSILGGYLDLFSATLRELPKVELSSGDRKHRLVDYVQLGEAVSRARKKEPGTFVSQYERRRQEEVGDLIEDNPVAGALRKLVLLPGRKGTFRGTMGELHNHLSIWKTVIRGLPSNARGLRGELNRIVGSLERAGIKVEFHGVVDGRSRISVSLIEGGPLANSIAAEKAKVAADAAAADAAKAEKRAASAREWKEKQEADRAAREAEKAKREVTH
jgi:hypothetical protein